MGGGIAVTIDHTKAFPAMAPDDNFEWGMDLRDWFAGQALIGRVVKHNVSYPEDIADDCYSLADAMMERRKKGSE